MKSSKVGKRADKSKVVEILNDKDSKGRPIMDGPRLKKKVRRYTMTCDMSNCTGIGRYDEIGEVICQNCGRVISQDPVRGAKMMISFESHYGSCDDDDGEDMGASGEPYLRPPPIPE